MHRLRIFIALAIVAAFSAGFAVPSAAAEVFRCVGSDGQVAFQDHACAANKRGDRVELPAAPTFAPSPDYAVADATRSTARGGHKRGPTRHAERGHETLSYECRADNGEVFYKHSACPKSIRIAASGRRGEKATVYQVSSVALTRHDACERMQHAVGRSGRGRDDGVSTYERNQGRDACRAY